MVLPAGTRPQTCAALLPWGAVAIPFKRSIIKRVGRGLPVAPLLLGAEVALIAARHASKLDRVQRRRLLALLRSARGRPSTLSVTERREVADLLAKLEPRLFLGSAVRKLSPVPVPKRLLFGPRGSDARRALSAKR